MADNEKLLAISKLPDSGTDIMIGNKVVEIPRQWYGLRHTGTGIHNGTITVIQTDFDKYLLYLACRHHLFEIIDAKVEPDELLNIKNIGSNVVCFKSANENREDTPSIVQASEAQDVDQTCDDPVVAVDDNDDDEKQGTANAFYPFQGRQANREKN